jgi:hypothetical protein
MNQALSQTQRLQMQEEFGNKIVELTKLKEAEQHRIKREWERKEEQAREDFLAEMLAKEYADQEALAKAQRDAIHANPEATFEEKEQADKRVIGFEYQADIDEVNAYFDEMVSKYERFGIATIQLEARRRMMIDAINEEYDNEQLAREQEKNKKILSSQIALANEGANLISSMSEFVGSMGVEGSKFQKQLAAIEIGIKTAASVASAIQGAITAAAQKGPAFPYVVGAYIASGVATVLSAFAQVNKLFNAAKEPQKPKYAHGQKFIANMPTFYKGGETGEKGIGYGDNFGEFTGFVHKNEYVVPEWLRKDAYVLNAEKIIEARRTGKPVPSKNETPQQVNVNIDIQALIMEIRALRGETVELKKHIGIKFGWNELDQLRSGLTKLDDVYKKSEL